MSAQPVDHPDRAEALFPMPPKTEVALRVAVRKLDLAAAVEFEEDFHHAWQEAVQTDSTVPMHMFLEKWAVWVSLHRYPDRSARLRELERAFQATETDEETRKAGAEIARLLNAAAAEAAG